MAAHLLARARRITWSVHVDHVKSFLLTSMVGYPTVTSWRPVTSRQHNIEYLIWLIMAAHFSAQARVHMVYYLTTSKHFLTSWWDVTSWQLFHNPHLLV